LPTQKDIIYSYQPTTFLHRKKGELIIASVVVAVLLISFINLETILITGSFLLLLADEVFRSFYYGWEIQTNQVILKRILLWGKFQQIALPFQDIQGIIYHQGFRHTPPHIFIKTANKKHILFLPYDIFKFAPTLLYLKKQHIRVSLYEFDHEIQLFLDERIDEIPMTNETVVKK